ncbi:MAG: ankyrin repeat domain-containing protein, partial [Mangrovibacterium sp.]
LLEAGADINAPHSYAGFEINALTALAGWGDDLHRPLKLAEWLIKHGAKIECYGRSAFLWAIWENKLDFIKLYADKGADLLFEEADGATMFSKIFTDSPSGNAYIVNDMISMLHQLKKICDKKKVAFPLDKTFVWGLEDFNDLQFSGELPTAFLFNTYLRPRYAELQKMGWDINKNFSGLYAHGKSSYDKGNTYLGHMLRMPSVNDAILTNLFDNCPELDISLTGERTALFWMIMAGISAEVICRVIPQTSNLDEIYEYSDMSFGYLYQVMKSDLTIADPNWKYTICKALLEAGCDPDIIMTQDVENSPMVRSEQTMLEYSAALDLPDIFKMLLDFGADPHRPMCGYEETLEHYIATRTTHRLSDAKAIALLEELDRRNLLDIEAKTCNGATPLLYAVSKGQTELVDYLIKKGANVHAVGGFDNSTAMNRAISNWNWVSKENRLRTVQLLADAGASVELTDADEYSPLMCAAECGCYTVAEELIKRGADVNQAVPYVGKTAVHFAVMGAYGYDEYPDDEDCEDNNAMNEPLKLRIIKLLAEKGADLNLSYERGYTPLIHAMMYGRMEIFEGLIKLGASVNAADFYGRTLLMMTSMYGSMPFVRVLGRQRNLNESFLLTDQTGNNALHYIVSRHGGEAEKQEDEIMQLLPAFIENCKIPIIRNKHGVSPLHLAALGGFSEVVEYLIKEQQMDVNEKDHEGNTPLLWTLDTDEEIEEMVSSDRLLKMHKTLINLGADVNCANADGKTPLMAASRCGKQAVVELLKEAGAKGDF